MANSGVDLQLTLNCRRTTGSWSVKFGSVVTPAHREQFLGNLILHDYLLDRFSPHFFRRFDNLVVLP